MQHYLHPKCELCGIALSAAKNNKRKTPYCWQCMNAIRTMGGDAEYELTLIRKNSRTPPVKRCELCNREIYWRPDRKTRYCNPCRGALRSMEGDPEFILQRMKYNRKGKRK